MIRREHRADRRRDDVEARVVVPHFLGIADLEADVEVSLCSALLGALDQYGRQIHSGDIRPALGREEAEVSRSATRVEPLHTRLRFEPFDDELVHVRERPADPLVGAVAPHRALARLQLCECHSVFLLGGRNGSIGRVSTRLQPPNIAGPPSLSAWYRV